MTVLIYQPSQNPMQSGPGKRHWVLEFTPRAPRRPDPFMGWNSQRDTLTQVRLSFPTREAAIEYAQKHGLEFHFKIPQKRLVKPKSYADNFRFGKPD